MHWWEYVLIGFSAQLINGTLGMGYGTIEAALLLAIGIVPSSTSAIIHISEVFVGGISGLMHYKFRNVNIRLFKKLLIPGIIGAILGASLLFLLKDPVYSHLVKKAMSVYILLLGTFILYKTFKKIRTIQKIKKIIPLAFASGFLDAFGGGGWSTILVSTLIAGGRKPLYVIGSVTLARLFVAFAGSAAFILLLGFSSLQTAGWVTLGGIAAAPIGPYIVKYIPGRTATIIISVLIILLSLKQIIF